jgi:hypothetical protein
MDRTEEEDVPDSSKEDKQQPPPIQKFIGFVVGVVLVFLAQRDLRKRPPELIRGKSGVWKVIAFVPPGAVAYLIFGRRRRSAIEAAVTNDAIAA